MIGLREIGKNILYLASEDRNNNPMIVSLNRVIHPLYSQDPRTAFVGWSIEEYMDWYSVNPSKEERMKYYKELASDWEDTRVD